MIVHYLVGTGSCCGLSSWYMSSDRAAVTCRRCIGLMETGAERPVYTYAPPTEKRRAKRKRVSEPKEGIPMYHEGKRVGGVVLDACPYKLPKGFAGDPYA